MYWLASIWSESCENQALQISHKQHDGQTLHSILQPHSPSRPTGDIIRNHDDAEDFGDNDYTNKYDAISYLPHILGFQD